MFATFFCNQLKCPSVPSTMFSVEKKHQKICLSDAFDCTEGLRVLAFLLLSPQTRLENHRVKNTK